MTACCLGAEVRRVGLGLGAAGGAVAAGLAFAGSGSGSAFAVAATTGLDVATAGCLTALLALDNYPTAEPAVMNLTIITNNTKLNRILRHMRPPPGQSQSNHLKALALLANRVPISSTKAVDSTTTKT